MESNDGSVEIDGARMEGTGIPISEGARAEEVIEIDDTLETEDGVRLRLRLITEDSDETGVGDGGLGGNESREGVGVREEDGEEGIVADIEELTSETGVRRERSDVTTELVGLRPDVSKEKSGGSGSAWD